MKALVILESVSFDRSKMDDEVEYVKNVDTDLISVNSATMTDCCDETAIISADVNINTEGTSVVLPDPVYVHLLGQCGTYLGRSRDEENMGFYTKYVVTDSDRTTYEFIRDNGTTVPPDTRSMIALMEHIAKGIISGITKVHLNLPM